MTEEFAKKYEKFKDWYDNHDQMLRDIKQKSFDDLLEMDLPKNIKLPEEISSLGQRGFADYKRAYLSISAEAGADMDALAAYVEWIGWLGALSGSLWFQRAINAQYMEDTPYSRLAATPKGHGFLEGFVNHAYYELSSSIAAPFLERIRNILGLNGEYSDCLLLRMMDLMWQWKASKALIGSEEFFSAICEAKDADSFSSGSLMWQASREALKDGDGEEYSDLFRRNFAKSAAVARHASTNETRSLVVDRYKQERDKYSSKDAAAFAFTKDFPFEFSTIRGWLKGA